MRLGVTDDRDLPAVGEHRVALGNRLGVVLRSLGVYVRLEETQQRIDATAKRRNATEAGGMSSVTILPAMKVPPQNRAVRISLK